jgi:hypothetical protein
MERFFNTSGPVVAADHYRIDPLQRVDWEEIQALIANKRYFVLHAPRQTGKTSTLLAMMDALNLSGRYTALYANIEAVQAARGDAANGLALVCEIIASRARTYGLADLQGLVQSILSNQQSLGALTELLTRWATISEKPIVLLLDEVDALVGDTLISLLRQIRAGYDQRPTAFPQSIILCGVRDVRDYRLHSPGHEVVTGGSAFNIKAKSLSLGNFTQAEIAALYQQHTDATGQAFAASIFRNLWEDTQGQPWLVNALGYELTWENRAARDRTTAITLEDYHAARERLIYSRATHLDQLTDKLREPRINTVVSALMSGEQADLRLSEDDLQYVEDLGLIVRKPQIHMANRIYQEIIPREITAPIQDSIVQQQAWFLTPEHRLDLPKLLAAFQQFFRENSEVWLQGLPYREAAPHLLLQAFLQRIVNGGGRINREYALGRKRTDLLIEWPINEKQAYHGEVQRIVLELKILHHSLEKTIADGVQQTVDYVRQVGASEAYLVIFNRSPEVTWDEKIWQLEKIYQGVTVGIWGM